MTRIAYGVTAVLTVAAIAADLLRAPVLLLFALAALALIGLAWVLGQATESVGHYAGPRVSGVLNATFGNAAELIITTFALSAGLTTVVKASIIGSVIGNALLVLGASILFGGIKNGTQSFSTTIAGANAAMLAIVAFGLAFPTVFATLDPGEGRARSTEYLSLSVAVVLLILYGLYLIFYLSRQEQTEEEEQPPFGKVFSFALLVGTVVAVAYISEAFVGAIEPLVAEIGISELFIGVILIPIIGNIAEHVVSVQIAYKDKMDFSMAISLGSSLQIALFVTPILVFLGPLLGHPLELVFSPLELGSLGAAVIVTAFIALDGESNWLEGAMLCGVYAIAALAFFFSP